MYFQSVSRGVSKNIAYYDAEFVSKAQDEIFKGQQLQGKLRGVLLPNACISVRITLRNAGKTSVTLRPYFGLRILHPEYSGKPIVMAAEPTDTSRKKNPFSLTEGGFTIDVPDADVAGKNVMAKPFLPEANASAYINIPPGEL